jgi:serine/threonine protein kinase
MSPEIMNGQRYNSKTDIWSLGCILYELLCLRLPFDVMNIRQLSHNIANTNPLNPPINYSKEIKELAVREMLAKNPKMRPSINAVLGRQFMRDKISSCLNETRRHQEFSHTVMHGLNIMKDNRQMPPPPNPPPPASQQPPAAVARQGQQPPRIVAAAPNGCGYKQPSVPEPGSRAAPPPPMPIPNKVPVVINRQAGVSPPPVVAPRGPVPVPSANQPRAPPPPVPSHQIRQQQLPLPPPQPHMAHNNVVRPPPPPPPQAAAPRPPAAVFPGRQSPSPCGPARAAPVQTPALSAAANKISPSPSNQQVQQPPHQHNERRHIPHVSPASRQSPSPTPAGLQAPAGGQVKLPLNRQSPSPGVAHAQGAAAIKPAVNPTPKKAESKASENPRKQSEEKKPLSFADKLAEQMRLVDEQLKANMELLRKRKDENRPGAVASPVLQAGGARAIGGDNSKVGAVGLEVAGKRIATPPASSPSAAAAPVPKPPNNKVGSVMDKKPKPKVPLRADNRDIENDDDSSSTSSDELKPVAARKISAGQGPVQVNAKQPREQRLVDKAAVVDVKNNIPQLVPKTGESKSPSPQWFNELASQMSALKGQVRSIQESPSSARQHKQFNAGSCDSNSNDTPSQPQRVAGKNEPPVNGVASKPIVSDNIGAPRNGKSPCQVGQDAEEATPSLSRQHQRELHSNNLRQFLREKRIEKGAASGNGTQKNALLQALDAVSYILTSICLLVHYESKFVLVVRSPLSARSAL